MMSFISSLITTYMTMEYLDGVPLLTIITNMKNTFGEIITAMFAFAPTHWLPLVLILILILFFLTLIGAAADFTHELGIREMLLQEHVNNRDVAHLPAYKDTYVDYVTMFRGIGPYRITRIRPHNNTWQRLPLDFLRNPDTHDAVGEVQTIRGNVPKGPTGDEWVEWKPRRSERVRRAPERFVQNLQW